MATLSLTGRSGDKVMCIVTDGMPDDRKAALEARDEAVRQGIDIMAIGSDGADELFLEQLATRNELSLRVSRDQLENGIASMVKMLPRGR